MLLVNNLPNGFSSKTSFISLHHFYQSLHLLLILFPYFFVAFNFELQALGLIDPIDSLAPGQVIVQLLENLLKLSFGRDHVLLLGVNDKVVVFSKNRYEGIFLLLHAPGQLLEKGKQFVLVNGVSFCETTDIDDGMQDYIMSLKFLQDFLANECPVVNFIKARNIQNAESHLLATYFEGTAVVVVDLGRDLLQAVGNLY